MLGVLILFLINLKMLQIGLGKMYMEALKDYVGRRIESVLNSKSTEDRGYLKAMLEIVDVLDVFFEEVKENEYFDKEGR